jgi:predicted Zn-dependent protease
MSAEARIEQIKSFLKKTPKDPFLWYALATEYLGKSEDAKAKDIFLTLKRDYPDYHATYYHLAKLYEREDNEEEAIKTYEEGMKVAKHKNEKHAYNELRSALDELLF